MTSNNPYSNGLSTTPISMLTNVYTKLSKRRWKEITYGNVISILCLSMLVYSHVTFFSKVQVMYHRPQQVPTEFFMEHKAAVLPLRRRIKEKRVPAPRRNKHKATKIKKAAGRTKEKKDSCEYIHINALESTIYPSCNIFHEVSMTQSGLTYLTEGTARATFLAKDETSTPIVFKISKWKKVDYSPYGLSQNRKDGMTLEALSASDYITQIYGYCGGSQILELGDGGNVQDLIQRSRDNIVNLSSLDRLKVSTQLATAVADLHELAHASHRDICCHQFVNVNGVYKLNDFHLTQYTEYRPRSKQVCMNGHANGYPKIHAPEEYYGRSTGDFDSINTEKADVYMLGNVLYNVLTNKWTYENYNTHESGKRLIKGIVPDIPSETLHKNKTDASVQIVLKAIQMCWTHNVKERPTARKVVRFLRSGLKNILGTNAPKVIRVKVVPPLEKDYSYSDAGFYKYLYRKDNVDIDHSEF